MKTLREYIDQLDEISRRGFLKGAGVAAVAGGTGGANAQSIADLEVEHAYKMAIARKRGKAGLPLNMNLSDTIADLRVEHAYKMARAEAGYPPVKSKPSTKESIEQVEEASPDALAKIDQVYQK